MGVVIGLGRRASGLTLVYAQKSKKGIPLNNYFLLCGLALIALLGGCASPRYQTVYRYEAPTDGGGRACVEKCAPQLSSCQTACQSKRAACVKNIEPEVDSRYQEALRAYEAAFEQYRRDMSYYQMHFAFGWGYRPGWYGPWAYSPWPEPYYAAPSPPLKPMREHVQAAVEKQRCDADCGCQPIYDACFLGCGGKKIPETQCIAHCPKN